jgi:hypothetical protein
MSDVKVIQVDPETKKVSLVLTSTKVTGVDKLIQLVILSLLTSPGSSLLEEDSGGGMEDLVGYNIGENDVSELQAEISRKVSRTQREIVKSQVGLNISAEEKLRKIDVVHVKPGADLSSVDVRIRIENEVGRTRDVVI